ncbi:MAG: molybdopterin dinucleotide binding domain-containing protein [Candidatus Thorarchaeota archaeon]
MSHVGVEATLTSGRTLKQGRAMELGKLGPEYLKEVSFCEMDNITLDALGLEEGDSVRIETLHGSVIVSCKLDRRAAPGIVFIPCGPFANAVIGPDTENSGMPDFKGVPAKLFAAKGQKVLDVESLLKQMLEDA